MRIPQHQKNCQIDPKHDTLFYTFLAQQKKQPELWADLGSRRDHTGGTMVLLKLAATTGGPPVPP